jgi:hypothetical protein
VHGHNIIRFDLPHLAAASSGRAAVLAKPAIDTLWHNPLAFPKNPFHRVVKHYHDGRLKPGHVNYPELDSRLVLEVLADQLVAMRELQRRSPHLLAAYHWLRTTRPEERGFDAIFAVFASVRGERRPAATTAQHAMRRALHGEDCIHQIGSVLAEPSQHGWERPSRGEDRDAARRLYYVAMTRARPCLTLMSMVIARHKILVAPNDRAFLIRQSNSAAPDTSQCILP